MATEELSASTPIPAGTGQGEAGKPGPPKPHVFARTALVAKRDESRRYTLCRTLFPLRQQSPICGRTWSGGKGAGQLGSGIRCGCRGKRSGCSDQGDRKGRAAGGRCSIALPYDGFADPTEAWSGRGRAGPCPGVCTASPPHHMRHHSCESPLPPLLTPSCPGSRHHPARR